MTDLSLTKFLGFFLKKKNVLHLTNPVLNLHQLTVISGDLVNILIDFLNNTRHRIKLNGQISAWASVDAGVPQGSILGPLLLFIDFNYLSDNLSSNVKLFADATFMVAFL